MLSRDSVTRSGLLRSGPAFVVVLLAGLLLSAGPLTQRLESAFYDWLQRLQSHPGSARIVLVDTTGLEDAETGIWASREFPDLLRALAERGAQLIVPVQPPPAAALLPDAQQLAALAELEQRARRANTAESGATPGNGSLETFAAQLAIIQRQSERQARLVETVTAVRNLIIPAPVIDGNPTAPLGTCNQHALDLRDSGDISQTDSVRAVRALATPGHGLCQAILGLGHAGVWSDADDIVRRTDLVVRASGQVFPALALAAALAADGVLHEAQPAISANAIGWGSRTIRTSGGATTLNRHYRSAGTEPAFSTIRAEDLLRGAVPGERIAGRIALLGNPAGAPGATYVTPVSGQTSATLLLATVLSNLLEGDYLLRPAWFPWLETALLAIIGSALLGWGPRMAPALAMMIGVCAATLLLAVEAILLATAGIWAEFVTIALFALGATATLHFWQQRAPAPAVPASAPAPALPPSPARPEEELDLAFSVLRQQPASDHVKKRLYGIALTHARRRDLARAERVLRHLATVDPHYRAAGDKLQKLAGLRAGIDQREGPPPAPAAAPAAAVEPSPLAGRTLGRYVLEQVIGRGAMATVYLGRDPRINRKVAVKTIALAQEFGDSDLANARTQFIREAESAGRLNHPAIITIYDVGEDGDMAYLAMEYFPGKPLSQFTQQGRLLPPVRVLELMARAADALHYAHSQHVVHRDIKPANLLYDEQTDSLKITDFGIARLTDTSRTKTGIILGTPSYMSPEQLAGTGVTGRSDLFSLGVTLYQLLTGVPPFRADSIPRLMQKIAHEKHDPARQLRDELPEGVDRALDRALAKEPNDRFTSGREMALALRDCCSRLELPVAVHTA